MVLKDKEIQIQHPERGNAELHLWEWSRRRWNKPIYSFWWAHCFSRNLCQRSRWKGRACPYTDTGGETKRQDRWTTCLQPLRVFAWWQQLIRGALRSQGVGVSSWWQPIAQWGQLELNKVPITESNWNMQTHWSTFLRASKLQVNPDFQIFVYVVCLCANVSLRCISCPRMN